MNKNGWKYYNHALIPDAAPHELPDVDSLHRPETWKKREGRVLLARWTTDFDCGQQTGWWYCICDRPFDMQALKSKRRNVIKNADKYCAVSICDPLEYEGELLELYNDAQNTYEQANRRLTDKNSFHSFLNKISADGDVDFYICFLKETEEVAGYAIVKNFSEYAEYQAHKVKPQLEKYQVNAALVKAVLEHYADRLGKNYYVSDGARNINHKTNFQDYLEKYFGFRKAYCTLHIRYRGIMKTAVSMLFPLRNGLKKFDHNKLVHQINGVLRMEEYRRQVDE